MGESLPTVYLVRHGETEWARDGKHSGRADVLLTAAGEEQARRLGRRLAGVGFDAVWASPLRRARRTCELAGFTEGVELVPDLMEWDYGDYQARTAEEVRRERPGWYLFRDGCPGGESVAEVSARGGRVVERLMTLTGSVLIFAHGHLLRVVAARWLGLPGDHARYFHLGTAGLCVLGFEHGTAREPVIRLWNDRSHLSGGTV